MTDERTSDAIGRMGDLVGNRYELIRPLARGGMAEVWEGLDHTLDRSVAVKMLHAHLAGDPEFFTRFHREAVAAAKLNHPNVVAVYDTGVDTTTDGVRRAYIVMELVRGETVRALTRRGIGVGDTVDIVSQAADGLDYAHRNGLVHRDVKPANILVRPDGRVQVADFGIAKAIQGADPTARAAQEDLTQAGSILGTAKYLAPEQVEGRPLDARTDVYALGVVLYELLCGQPPFVGANDMSTALMHVQQAPVAPRLRRGGIPSSLEAIVLRALHKDPTARFASAAEFARALRGADLTPDDAVPLVQRSVHDITPPNGLDADAPTTVRDPTTARPAPPHAFDPTTVSPGRRGAARQAQPASTGRATPAPVHSTALAKPRARRRGGVLAAALVAMLGGGAGAAAGWLYTNNPAKPRPNLALTGVDAFDPFGDGHENDTELRFAKDANPSTVWSTFPGEEHRKGVGLWVSLRNPGDIAAVRIDAAADGWAAEIYVASTPRESLAAWGRPVATIPTGSTGDNTVALAQPVRGGYVLIWFTNVGKDGRMRVRDVYVEGPT